MGTHILDALIIKVVLDTSEYDKGEREVDATTKRLRETNKKAFTEMEDRGKSAASTFKGLRNEVVGLGLAFMGAQSIVGFAANLMTGAASADRLGNTMNMNVKQIWAWRMAMKGVGGDVKDADAALSSIQRDKMNYRFNQMDRGRLNTYGRLGITGNDLRDADPGDILKKLAHAQPKMEAQQYASFLQQIGLPASTVAFLQEGKGSVDKLIDQFEKDAKGQEKLASETKNLQESMAKLQSTIAEQLVPPLTTIANALNLMLGPLVKEGPHKGDPLYAYTGGKNAWDYIGGAVGGSMGKWISENMGAQGSKANHPPVSASGASGGGGWGNAPASRSAPAAAQHGDDHIVRYFMSKGLSHDQALGIRAAIEAEGGLKQPIGGGYKGRAIGIGQLLGSRRAEFLKRYGNKFTLQNQLDFMWWELQGGDPLGGGAHVLKETSSAAVLRAMITKFYRPAKGFQTHRDLIDGAAYIRAHRHHGTIVHQTNHYHIKSTDPKGAAREIGQTQRRHAVAQVDRGAAP